MVASLQPLGPKLTQIVDMLTDESFSLSDMEHEIFTKNINNITKFTLIAVLGSGVAIVGCFAAAAVAFVLGLSAVPVFCALVVLLGYETTRSKEARRQVSVQLVQGVQPVSVSVPE